MNENSLFHFTLAFHLKSILKTLKVREMGDTHKMNREQEYI